MEYFFRHNIDKSVHIPVVWIRVAMALAIFLAYCFRKKDFLLKFSLQMGILIQILLLYWYWGDSSLFLKEGLPLYHCRISMFLLWFGYYGRRERLLKYFAWLGFVGGMVSFALPDPSPYLWPHVTNLSFVGGHICLVVASAIILARGEVFLKEKEILKITFDDFSWVVLFILFTFLISGLVFLLDRGSFFWMKKNHFENF